MSERQFFIVVSWDGRTAECVRNRFRYSFTDADVISDQMPYDFAVVIASDGAEHLRNVVVYAPPESGEVDAVVAFVCESHGFAKPVSKANVDGRCATLYIRQGDASQLQPGDFVRGRVAEIAEGKSRLVDVQPFSLHDEVVTESETGESK